MKNPVIKEEIGGVVLKSSFCLFGFEPNGVSATRTASDPRDFS
jgi:hypothetical protein